MDFPVGVSPFADARVVSFLNADTLIPGSSIIDLLVVDGAVLDRGFHQGMAKTGTIGGACFHDEGSIGIPGSTAYFSGFGKQDFASDLNQPFAKGQSGGTHELLHFCKIGVHNNHTGSRPHTWQLLNVAINGSKGGSQKVFAGMPAKSNHLPKTGT